MRGNHMGYGLGHKKTGLIDGHFNDLYYSFTVEIEEGHVYVRNEIRQYQYQFRIISKAGKCLSRFSMRVGHVKFLKKQLDWELESKTSKKLTKC